MQLEPRRPQFLGDLPPGESGTRMTLALMRRLVSDFKRSPIVREAALSLIADVSERDWLGEVNALFTFVRDHVRYTRDIHDLETVQTPVVTLDLLSGDCDDKSVLLAALLESVGHEARFVATGYRTPHNYSHVYVETPIAGKWITLDSTVRHVLGWNPRTPTARMTA